MPIPTILRGIPRVWAARPAPLDRHRRVVQRQRRTAADLDLLWGGHRAHTHSVGAVIFVALLAAAMAVKAMSISAVPSPGGKSCIPFTYAVRIMPMRVAESGSVFTTICRVSAVARSLEAPGARRANSSDMRCVRPVTIVALR